MIRIYKPCSSRRALSSEPSGVLMSQHIANYNQISGLTKFLLLFIFIQQIKNDVFAS